MGQKRTESKKSFTIYSQWNNFPKSKHYNVRRMGVLVENFRKNPLEVTKSCFMGDGLNFFSPKRY